MNFTVELITILIIASIGIYIINKLQYDYRLIYIFKNYPLPSVLKPGGIIDLEKLNIFVQNIKYSVETRGTVRLEANGGILKVVDGEGHVVIKLEAWGYLDRYKVEREIQVIS